VFDLRYHVASLAAVFLMLVVGILIGVGISGRGFVDDAERDRLEGQIEALEEDLATATAGVEDLEVRQGAAEDFVEGAYPVLAENRLDGRRVAVLVLGSTDPTVQEIEEGFRLVVLTPAPAAGREVGENPRRLVAGEGVRGQEGDEAAEPQVVEHHEESPESRSRRPRIARWRLR